MKEPILRAVAMPPRLFWAPMVPAMANLGLQFPMVFMFIAIWDINPLMMVVTILIVHLGLIAAGAKEPHLSNMMKSRGPFMKTYKNIYSERGTKLAP